MNREIKYIIIHNTHSQSLLPIAGVRLAEKANGTGPQFHCIIDYYGHAARIVGMNFTTAQDVPENENCYHIAYVGGLHGTDTRNPVQTHVLYEKILELKTLFPNAKVIGADVHRGWKDIAHANPGFDVETWMNFYKDHRDDWCDHIEPESEEEQCVRNN